MAESGNAAGDEDADATGEAAVRVEEARARGLVLGAALGDAAGVLRGRWPERGTLRVGVATQLGAFTIEGFIRAMVRWNHRGICHPPSVVRFAYWRWGVLQGIVPGPASGRLDGWLYEVPELGERRGSAPATVAMLLAGASDGPATPSRGAHALTRSLGLAVARALGRGDGYAQVVRGIAELTHGAPDAQEAALRGTELLAHCLTGADPLPHLPAALADLPVPPEALGLLLAGPANGPDPTALARLAPDATAVSALLGGLYVFTRFRRPGEIGSALRFAATAAPDAPSVAATAGAFLGAAHGVDALPAGKLARLELAWALDVLARDLLREVSGPSPGGGAYTEGTDPYWTLRYPGG